MTKTPAVRIRRLLVGAFVLVTLVVRATGASAAGVHVAMTPALVEVDPGGEFTIDFADVAADAPFNGFDAVVEYDPALLTLLPTAPTSLQQGALMTDVCGNTFHLFAAAADSITFTSALLCAGGSVTGPGTLYTLRFRAGGTIGTTAIRLRSPRVRFYNAGLYVFPVTTADAEVHIGSLTGVTPAGAPGLSLRALPNPSRPGATTLRLYAGAAGPQQVTIHDARGRLVRSFAWPDPPAGERVLTWDGLDQRGALAPAGIYLVVFRAGARSAFGRITLIH